MALLRCSVMSSIGGSQLAFLTITDGQSTNYAAPPADTRRVCACTFYLVFKEPEVVPPLRRQPSSGEPFNLTNAWRLCQPPTFSFFIVEPARYSRHRQQLPISAGRYRRGMVEPRRLALADVRRTAPNPPNIRSAAVLVNLAEFPVSGAVPAVGRGWKVSIEIKISEIKHSRSP
jgi:hypothetical protein